MSGLILPGRQVFIVDTHVNLDPTRRAAGGNHAVGRGSAVRLRPRAQGRAAVAFEFRQQRCTLGAEDARDAGVAAASACRDSEVDGEMHGDCALDEAARRAILPDSTLHGSANLLVCPNLDSANIAYNLLKSAAGHNVAIGPILLGCAAPGAHPDPGGHGAAHRQHDGGDRGRGQPTAGCRTQMLSAPHGGVNSPWDGASMLEGVSYATPDSSPPDGVWRAGLAGLVVRAGPPATRLKPPRPMLLSSEWQHRQLTFAYSGFTTLYTCEGLADHVRQILQYLGARKDAEGPRNRLPGAIQFAQPDRLCQRGFLCAGTRHGGAGGPAAGRPAPATSTGTGRLWS